MELAFKDFIDFFGSGAAIVVLFFFWRFDKRVSRLETMFQIWLQFNGDSKGAKAALQRYDESRQRH